MDRLLIASEFVGGKAELADIILACLIGMWAVGLMGCPIAGLIQLHRQS